MTAAKTPYTRGLKSTKSTSIRPFETFETPSHSPPGHDSDLLTLIGDDTQLRYASRTNGGEYAGPCPFCGGRDRFRVWPNQVQPGWWCRQCQRHGDAAGYVVERDGVSYRDACRQLGTSPRRREQFHEHVHPVDVPPPRLWQYRARMFVQGASTYLWSPRGQEAYQYLRDVRCLTDETIGRWMLGFNPTGGSTPAEEWGISTENGNVWLPPGIVIPREVGGELWGIRIRQLNRTPKYLGVTGSRTAFFGSTRLRDGEVASTVVLTEGEFDAMLLYQEAGDLVGVLTLGSASSPLSTRCQWELRSAARILAAYDADFAGQTAANRLAHLDGRMHVVRPPGAKDLTEMQQGGGDVRTWVRWVLSMNRGHA